MGVARDNTWRLKMKTLCLLAFGLIPLCMTTHIHTEDDLDDNDRLDEDEFEEAFDLKRIYDPAEKAKRAARLAKTEEEVKEENEDYIDGKASWYAKIYETADRDPKELVKEMGEGRCLKWTEATLEQGDLWPQNMKDMMRNHTGILKRSEAGVEPQHRMMLGKKVLFLIQGLVRDHVALVWLLLLLLWLRFA